MDTNILIYEGEYLNKRKNGKGKEYDIYGRLIYEGNYLKGKKNGKKRMETVKNILKMVIYYLKVNIQIIKDIMEKDIIFLVFQNLKLIKVMEI